MLLLNYFEYWSIVEEFHEKGDTCTYNYKKLSR